MTHYADHHQHRIKRELFVRGARGLIWLRCGLRFAAAETRDVRVGWPGLISLNITIKPECMGTASSCAFAKIHAIWFFDQCENVYEIYLRNSEMRRPMQFYSESNSINMLISSRSVSDIQCCSLMNTFFLQLFT